MKINVHFNIVFEIFLLKTKKFLGREDVQVVNKLFLLSICVSKLPLLADNLQLCCCPNGYCRRTPIVRICPTFQRHVRNLNYFSQILKITNNNADFSTKILIQIQLFFIAAMSLFISKLQKLMKHLHTNQYSCRSSILFV